MTNLPGTYQPMSTGWVCPKCSAVMAPTMMMCFYCKPVETKISTSAGTFNQKEIYDFIKYATPRNKPLKPDEGTL